MWKVKPGGTGYGVIRKTESGADELHYPGYVFADEQTAQRLADELNEEEKEHAD